MRDVIVVTCALTGAGPLSKNPAQPITPKQTSGTVNNFLPVKLRELRQHRTRQHVAAIRAFIAENAVIKQINSHPTALAQQR